MSITDQYISLEKKYCAHNYDPFPIVLDHGEGVYLWDVKGNKYLDMMSAYSAVSHGHKHPRLLSVLQKQASKLAIISRGYHNDCLPRFIQRACELTKMDMALPMNTGVEAVETALKAARKWGYEVKGIPENVAEIIVCENNFHGRTIAVVSFSSEEQYRKGFGPFPKGFVQIPFGDNAALKAAINKNTAAFLVEPIQGEGGIVVPAEGYLAKCAEICKQHNVLMLCDEIQTGLGRTGKMLASWHEGVTPDGIMLGKALGGGLLPVSMFLAKKDVMNVYTPGDHGSTFGGNPLAAAVGFEALNVIVEERLIERAAELGEYLLTKLRQLTSPIVKSVRGKGLLTGIEIDTQYVSGREFCNALIARGVLSKETHETVIRLAPPLIITKEQIEFALVVIRETLKDFELRYQRSA
ncbi:MAG: ornithine--oxo-acid transaminase [Gammaproteobacteria bacterium]|nr:ornithine--oxo-acid transaminase [Gammaproteobacteria bacterium]